MIRTKLKKASANPGLHEARPLLLAITIGLVLALTLTVAAAWRPDQSITTQTTDTSYSR
ncbi:hypothetical protein [uncultured Roseibium sp.]|uniref:hypothetical protein n=1 Tax=uncultured Roseibium sp. TaxID=1936171 RepID=UPI0032169283